MKYIKIFLASSIEEFEYQRKDLGDYIRSLNDIYVKRGIYFEYDICENLSSAMSQTRKQDEYNEKIRNSEYFYLLFGQEVGQYTEEEFDVALEKFRQTGLPRIYTYFQKMQDGNQPKQSVLDFMKKLDKQLGHYYVMFQDIDSVKLNILLELVRNENMEKSVSVEDGKVKALDKEVLELNNIPIYHKNEHLHHMKEQKAQLDERYMELRLRFSKEPTNEKVFAELMKIAEERDAVSDQIARKEKDMFSLYREAIKMGCDGKPMTERARKARRLLEEGDYQGALLLLNDIERKKEREQCKELKEHLQLRMKCYIEENRLKILALHGLEQSKETELELEQCYQENVEIAMEYQTDYGCLYEYASYLVNLHRFTNASQVLDKMEKIYDLFGNCSEKELMDLYILKAEVYSRLGESRLEERYLRKGVQLAEQAQEHDQKQTIFNNYAACCMKRQKPEKAEIYLKRALEYCDDKNGEDAAISYGNLAHCLRAQYGNSNAEKLREIKDFFSKALDIAQKLYQNSPKQYAARFAETHQNLADYYFDLCDEPEKAGEFYRRALELFREAGRAYPEKYLISVVQIITEVAYYYDMKKAFDESEPLYGEALQIIEKLRRMEPEAYEGIHARLLHNYGYMLAETGRYRKSIKHYQMAEELYRKLIQKENMEYLRSLRVCEQSIKNLSQRQ